MADEDDKPSSGEIFGVPYNFEKPSLRRLVSSYWRPGERMLVKKPFGVGYTLNLANWRAWIVVAVAAGLLWQEKNARAGGSGDDDEEVEVIVED